MNTKGEQYSCALCTVTLETDNPLFHSWVLMDGKYVCPKHTIVHINWAKEGNISVQWMDKYE